MSKNDGGPAFPQALSGGDFDPGMSLRDFFAGLAMAVILHRNQNDTYHEDAQRTYWAAQAMIDTRPEKGVRFP